MADAAHLQRKAMEQKLVQPHTDRQTRYYLQTQKERPGSVKYRQTNKICFTNRKKDLVQSNTDRQTRRSLKTERKTWFGQIQTDKQDTLYKHRKKDT